MTTNTVSPKIRTTALGRAKDIVETKAWRDNPEKFLFAYAKQIDDMNSQIAAQPSWDEPYNCPNEKCDGYVCDGYVCGCCGEDPTHHRFYHD